MKRRVVTRARKHKIREKAQGCDACRGWAGRSNGQIQICPECAAAQGIVLDVLYRENGLKLRWIKFDRTAWRMPALQHIPALP